MSYAWVAFSFASFGKVRGDENVGFIALSTELCHSLNTFLLIDL